MTEEEFQTQVEAVHVQVSEKDITLRMEDKRLWDEIAVTHTYLFDRQDQEIAALKTLTLPAFQAYFLELFFSSSSKRIDLELTATKHASSQAEWAAKNTGSTLVDVSPETFKKRCSLHPDSYKTNFARN